MQHQHVKTTIYRVGNVVFTVKTRQSRLCHDRAIQGRNGVLPLAAAKQGKNHRVCSGTETGFAAVTPTPPPIQGRNQIIAMAVLEPTSSYDRPLTFLRQPHT